jgi:hypothetical protein
MGRNRGRAAHQKSKNFFSTQRKSHLNYRLGFLTAALNTDPVKIYTAEEIKEYERKKKEKI